MKIYTRTGDTGETALFDGTRVRKSDSRVAAYGDVDELNAWLGLVHAQGVDSDLAEMIVRIQRDLFALGSRLADPAHRIADRVTKAAITPRISAVSRAGSTRSKPSCRRCGGSSFREGRRQAPRCTWRGPSAAARSERSWSWNPTRLEPELLVYVNRLSDLLFVMARAVNRRAAVPELEW